MRENVRALILAVLLLSVLVIAIPAAGEETPPTWSNDLRLTEAEGNSSLKPRIAKDSADDLHIVFNDYRHGPSELYYMKVDTEGNILVDEKVFTVTDAASSSLGDMALDSNDNLHVVWADIRDTGPLPNMEVYYEKLDSMGNTLVDERRLTFAPYYSHYASIAVDSSDDLHIAWCEEIDVAGTLQEEIHYMKLDNDGNTIVEDLPITELDANESLFPNVAVDSDDNVHIVWVDDRNETGTAKSQELYYTKLNNDGMTLVDDTHIFSRCEHFKPNIVIDSSDYIHLVFGAIPIWHGDTYNQLYYQKLDNDGNFVGGDIGLTNDDGNATHSTVEIDSEDNIHMVWEDERHGNEEIYYMKLDDVGGILIEEQRLTDNFSKSIEPQITLGQDDGLNVVWPDGRAYEDGDRVEIYYKYSLISHINIHPTVNISLPISGQTVSGKFEVTGNSTDEDGTVQVVQVRIDEEVDWDNATGTTTWTYDWDTTLETNGLHTIYARSFDGSNYSEEQMITVTVDNIPPNEPPTVRITSPTGATVSGTIPIRGSASDPDGNVVEVQITIQGSGWITVGGTKSWIYSWDTTQVKNAGYTIYARSLDDQKEYSSLDSVTVTVDNFVNNPPEVEIQTPSPDEEELMGVVIIEGTATDFEGDGTITSVAIRISGEGEGNWITANGTVKWTHTWNTSEIEDGEYKIEARAYDGYEFSPTASVTVQVNNPRAPELTLTSKIPDKASGTLTLSGIASDEDGDIEKVEIQVDYGDWVLITDYSTFSYELDTTDLSDGEHIIRIRVTDDEDEVDMETLNLEVDNSQKIPFWTLLLLILILIVLVIIIAAAARVGKYK